MNCLNPSTQGLLNNSLLFISTREKWLFCCCPYWKYQHVALALPSHFANSRNAEISYKWWGVEVLVRTRPPEHNWSFSNLSSVSLWLGCLPQVAGKSSVPCFSQCLNTWGVLPPSSKILAIGVRRMLAAIQQLIFLSYHRLVSLSASWPLWLQLAVPKGKETNIIIVLVARSNISQRPGE